MSIRAVSAILAALLLAPQARAIHNDRRFERIGVAEGLSNLSVSAIVQDRRGFIWLGTEEGLNRFDGRSMSVYRRDPGNRWSLGANRISSLLVDSRGTLWVGTRGGGISRYDAMLDRFETFRFDPADPASISQDQIASIAEDRQGRLWVGTTRGGLNRIDLSDAAHPRFIRMLHDGSNPGSLADDRTRTLLVDRRGRLWIGTMSGLDRLVSENPPRFAHYRSDPARASSIGTDQVWALAEDRRGTIWAGTWGGGLSRLQPGSVEQDGGSFTNYVNAPSDPFSISDNRVMTLLEDGNGTLWVGTQSGLNELLPAESMRTPPRFIRHRNELNTDHSVAGDNITSAFQDRDGDFWFGTATNGASRLERRQVPFRHLAGIDPLDPNSLGPADVVNAVLEDREGVLWVGTSKGLERIVRSADRFTPDQVTHFRQGDGTGFAGSSAGALLQDHRGTIWIASFAGLLGLTMEEAHRAKPRFVQYLPKDDDPASLASNAILSLHEDGGGTLWIGTYRGLHRAVPGPSGLPQSFVRYRHDRQDPTTLSADTINSIASESSGALWVGTYFGLNRFEPGTGKVERFVPDPRRADSLSHEFVNTVHVDGKGTLWVGTWGGGLCRFDARSRGFQLYGVREGLPAESVNDIAEDRDHGIWLATPRGMARLDSATGAVRTLDARDGLHTQDLSTLAWGANGLLLAGGTAGITSFDPHALAIDRKPPRVELTGFRIFNRAITPGPDSVLKSVIGLTDRVELRHSQYLFAVDFAALAFSRPEKVRYAYRLEGFDPDWIAADGGERKAVYSSVPPGGYRFRVRAANADGVWNNEGRSIALTVLPPWWMTWWARAAALVLLVVIAVSWPLVRLARARRLSRELEEMVQKRTAELAEANRLLDAASRTDPLTNLPNRRHFLEQAEEQVVSFRRYARPFSVVLADVDNFKSVNDTWGHDAGDAVLRSVAEVFRETIRESDVVARWGGEEFILLLPETAAGGAVELADKVRRAIAAASVPVGQTQLSITATFGVSEVGSSASFDECVSLADAALYRGKHLGKNRVVAAGAQEI